MENGGVTWSSRKMSALQQPPRTPYNCTDWGGETQVELTIMVPLFPLACQSGDGKLPRGYDSKLSNQLWACADLVARTTGTSMIAKASATPATLLHIPRIRLRCCVELFISPLLNSY